MKLFWRESWSSLRRNLLFSKDQINIIDKYISKHFFNGLMFIVICLFLSYHYPLTNIADILVPSLKIGVSLYFLGVVFIALVKRP